MKSFTCKASNNIVINSMRDRNEAAVVMQINFTELKSEINASERINTQQRIIINASQRIINALQRLIINASQKINATQRINTQQRIIINASQRINASQNLKKVLVTEYTVSWHKYTTLTMIRLIKVFNLAWGKQSKHK